MGGSSVTSQAERIKADVLFQFSVRLTIYFGLARAAAAQLGEEASAASSSTQHSTLDCSSARQARFKSDS
eukprot:9405591-Pyramimonas_sp.AAC.1